MPIDPRAVVAEALAEWTADPGWGDRAAAIALELIARTPCPRCGQDGSVGWHYECGRSWCRACGHEVERTDE